jgi:hypothetical protein
LLRYQIILVIADKGLHTLSAQIIIMAKKIVKQLKLQIVGGKATPAPPRPALFNVDN